MNGLTRARIFGFIFLIYLAYLLLVMFFEIVHKLTQKQLFGSVVPLSLLFIAAISVINIDGLIATKYQPRVNNEIDYFYITSLSADSYPAWKGAVVEANQITASMVGKDKLSGDDYRKLFYIKNSLRNIQLQMENIQKQKWQSYNLGKDEANMYVKDNQEIFQKVDALVVLVNELEQKVDMATKNTTTLDRDVTPPLVQ
jgi:hypothetical protein